MTELTQELMEQLSKSFDPQRIEWKPQATSGDKSRALAIAYADARAYQDRLNAVVGADWSDSYTVLDGGTVVLCQLTVCGVTRSDIGEAPANDRNTATSALSQAFKRAAVKFGVGRYLYDLPATWADYDARKRRFTDAALKRLEKSLHNNAGNAGNGNAGNGNAGPVQGPRVFTSPKEAWRWGMERGAFTELDEAAAVYSDVKRKAKPKDAESMAAAWKAEIGSILAKQARLAERLN